MDGGIERRTSRAPLPNPTVSRQRCAPRAACRRWTAPRRGRRPARLLCSSSTETPARTRQVSSGTRRKWRSGKQRTAALPGAQQSKFTQPVLAKLGVADMDGAAELRARGRADKPNPFQRRSHIGIPRMKENQARNVWHLLLSGIKPGRDSRVRSAGANARHPDDRTRGRNARRSGAAAGAVEGASCAV